ncbi:MAG TPA: succinyl-diaminopimelate desuccinylase [Devosiaceae bacterium]|nr:succinyl-diaminopimelate desuccinylase [Devosiaceae bacterium]
MPRAIGREADPADLLAALIRCPSVTPDDAGSLGVLADYLEPLGFGIERLRFEGGGSYPVDNLFATRGTGGPHLLYGGHVDVVPAGHEADWTHPPFSGALVDGEIWGRGAVDMKGSVAAFCAALHAVVGSGAADAGTISLIITADEEADGVNGTKKVLEWAAARGHKFDFGLVGEPTSRDTFGDMLKTGRRGSLNGRIEIKGAQGHSAYPHEARNPLPVLARVVSAIASTPLDDGTASFPPSHLTMTAIDTGNPAANVIPGRAEARFNVRFNDRWTELKLQSWLAERIMEVPAEGCDVTLEILPPVARAFVSAGAPGVEMLAASVTAVTGRVPECSTSGGTSDARFVADYCPVAEFGGVGKLSHKTDERVGVAELVDLSAVYAHFVGAFLGPDSD